MFNKNFKFSSQHNLSNKDKKELTNDLHFVYNPDEIQKLVTNKSDLVFKKIAGEKDSLVFEDKNPLFILTEGQ